MATEVFANIKEGPIRPSAVVESFIANGAVELFGPVVLAAPGTGETLPRVGGTTTGGNAAANGISVGPKLASGKAADAAGDRVNVVVHGLAKCKVADAVVSRNDALETGVTSGVARVQADPTVDPATLATLAADVVIVNNNIRKAFIIALTASANANSIVAVFVNPQTNQGDIT